MDTKQHADTERNVKTVAGPQALLTLVQSVIPSHTTKSFYSKHNIIATTAEAN